MALAVLNNAGAYEDRGRTGALAFEGIGTKLTMDSLRWPERILGIDRPGDQTYKSLLVCVANDGIREGRLQRALSLEKLGIQPGEIEGIEAFV